jgi:hypothetical protein
LKWGCRSVGIAVNAQPTRIAITNRDRFVTKSFYLPQNFSQVLINALTGQMDFHGFMRDDGTGLDPDKSDGPSCFCPVPKTARLAVGRLRRSYAEKPPSLTNCKQIRKNGGGGGS